MITANTYYGLDVNAKGDYGVGYQQQLNINSSITDFTLCLWFYPPRYLEESIFFYLRNTSEPGFDEYYYDAREEALYVVTCKY